MTTPGLLVRGFAMLAFGAYIGWSGLHPTPTDGARRQPAPQARWWVDYGDDTGRYANDGECDDPRFEGAGAASWPQIDDRGHDATDCRRLHEAGQVQLSGIDLVNGRIDFGADRGPWTGDGECDDPRFEGAGMARTLLVTDRQRDATDCGRLYGQGRIRPSGVYAGPGR